MVNKLWSTKQRFIAIISITFLWPILLISSAAAQGNDTWQTYTNGNYINDLAVEDDYIWAATDGGLVRWDRVDGSYVKYTVTEGLASNRVQTIAVDSRGWVWVGYEYSIDGVSMFDGQTWTAYTTEDVLAGSRVLTVVADQTGRVWIGTNKGLSVFDGQAWTIYTSADGLGGSFVQTIAIDATSPDNTVIWAGTSGGGLSKLMLPVQTGTDDRANEGNTGQTWTTYTTEDGLPNNHVRTIAVDKPGQLWVGFDSSFGGVSHFDGQTWHTYTTVDGLGSNLVDDIAVDREGHIWFSLKGRLPDNPTFRPTFGLGVSRFDGQTWRTFTRADGLAGNDIRAITTGDDGYVWFGTWGGGISQLDLTAFSSPAQNEDATEEAQSHQAEPSPEMWQTYITRDELVHNDVRAIAVPEAGHYWFGTARGVSELVIAGADGEEMWHTYTTAPEALASNFIQTMAIDQAGHKWFGFGEQGGGVSEFDGETWRTYTSADGLVSDYVYAIAVDQAGHKWFGTMGGLSQFDGETWTNYTPADGLPHNFIQALTVDEAGSLWIGTQAGGASYFDGENWITYTVADGLLSNNIKTIAIGPDGQRWFGTDLGVSRFDGQTWTHYTKDDALTNSGASSLLWDTVNDIVFEPQTGQPWLAISEELLPKAGRIAAVYASRFTGSEWMSYGFTDMGVGSLDGWVLTVDQAGAIWFGTDRGVGKFDGQSWTAYTVEDGLPYKEIRAMAVDEAGHIWFGSWGGGVSEFDGQSWTYYTTAGLADNIVNIIAIDQNGYTWFGTEGGVTVLAPPAKPENIPEPEADRVWTTYTTAHGLAAYNVQDVAFDRAGHIWLAALDTPSSENERWALGGISELMLPPGRDQAGSELQSLAAGFDRQNWQTHSTEAFRAVAVDESDHIWGGIYYFGDTGPRGSVKKFDGQTWQYQCSYSGILAIAIDQTGQVWAGTYQGNAIKITQNSAQTNDTEPCLTYTPAEGLTGGTINAIVIDSDDNKWFATSKGVNLFDNQIWQTYTTTDGLANNRVQAIAIDPQGRAWFGTTNGISVKPR